MSGKLFIKQEWQEGKGELFSSVNPATSEVIWQGKSAEKTQVNQAVEAALKAFPAWTQLSVETRIPYLERFSEELKKARKELQETISKETGKPLWEADTEVGAMINKLSISLEAYKERCQEHAGATNAGYSITRHRAHGVIAIFGPFNLPGHLPNGHIIPALLAGNTVVFKPSELTPLVAEKVFECWEKAELPQGVIGLIQGGADTGKLLAQHRGIQGLFFTGSAKVGQELLKSFGTLPGKILALELGGNNPLVVHRVKDLNAAAYTIIQSAYITAGQRCTCARRLIMPRGKEGNEIVDALIAMCKTLKVGPYFDTPEPFMGPVVSNAAAKRILDSYQNLRDQGAKPLLHMQRIHNDLPFLSPGLLDVTPVQQRQDEEIFGPLLQLIWVNDFEEALLEANNTSYGLAAGLLCDDQDLHQQFLNTLRVGIMHWNRPLTGASSRAPFGGVGQSGNYRPSAFYAADYCAYPVASLEEKTVQFPKNISPGISL